MRLVVFTSALLFAASAQTGTSRVKRQFSIDDLINSALSIVKPIFDTSQPIRVDDFQPMIRKQIGDAMNHRESDILGAPKYSSLSQVPICRGNSRICKFISCTAANFKNDDNFANLNLAAQVIGDKKLRQAISSDPDTINTVCHEQGLSLEQCKVFSRGFQFIDKFISTIEEPQTKQLHKKEILKQDPYKEEPDAPPVPIRPQEDEPLEIPSRRGAQPQGSHTWSTRERAPLVVTEPPITWFPTLPPLPTFPTMNPLWFTPPTLPTFPTMPPPTFAPHVVGPVRAENAAPSPASGPFSLPAVKLPPNTHETSFSMDNQIFSHPFQVTPIMFSKLSRAKRSDYYDQIDRHAERSLGLHKKPVPQKEVHEEGGEPDYYDATADLDDDPNPAPAAQNKKQLNHCFQLLG
uniref:Secreted protein n=1 Tax=Steinernema glaseri TaxID=37863 RepID=A0A1I7YMN3_9BILA